MNLSIAGLAVVLIAAAVWGFGAPGPAASRGASTTVVLPPGAGIVKIADLLARSGVIQWRGAFILAAELTGAAPRLKAGEYDFRSHASLEGVLGVIRDGWVVHHFITIPEGLTSRAAADILAHAGYLTGPAPIAPEGSLLPETYEARRGESRAAVTRRMIVAQTALLAALWRGRAANLFYRTPREAVTLASVVEKETAKAGERAHIAAVFLNRLKSGMRLESDPTVIYGLTGGRALGHGLRVSELASPTPYNTYLTDGLPPAPIGNPGRAALAAVFHPEPSDDLYFVADGTGGHVFATTFKDHRRNVAKWRAIQRVRLSAEATP